MQTIQICTRNSRNLGPVIKRKDFQRNSQGLETGRNSSSDSVQHYIYHHLYSSQINTIYVICVIWSQTQIRITICDRWGGSCSSVSPGIVWLARHSHGAQAWFGSLHQTWQSHCDDNTVESAHTHCTQCCSPKKQFLQLWSETVFSNMAELYSTMNSLTLGFQIS